MISERKRRVCVGEKESERGKTEISESILCI